MKAGKYFFRTALNNLRRGGQRILVALLCVAFGVMSLVAMTTLAKSIEAMLVLEPYKLIGGDLTLDRVGEDVISEAEEGELKQLLQKGIIDAYTLIDYSTSLAFHLPESGELNFPSTAMGVDGAVYPLAGSLTLADPLDKSLAELIRQVGDVVITRDLALEYDLVVGDSLVLTDLNLGTPLEGHVRGIASDTPNHQGSKVYYSHDTAARLMGKARTGNTVLVNAEDPDLVQKLLETTGWRVFTADALADMTKAREGAMGMGLNDLGLLGLLVGGLGIANTMQVLMRRRRREVAIWKTLGYTSGQLQLLFVFEAALLGAMGSLLGAGLGVLLSYGLVDIFSRTTSVLIRWVFSPIQGIAGIAIGMFTTVLFAMWAILSTSRVRPSVLLRNETVKASQVPVLQGIGLGLVLLIPFLCIAGWILGSYWTGMLVLLASLAGLCMLGIGLWILSWIVTRLLPLNLWPLGRISRNNLRRHGASMMFAMVAIFVGVVSLSLGAVITQSGKNIIRLLKGNPGQENLAIYASVEDEAAIRQVLQDVPVESSHTGYQTIVLRIHSEQSPDTVFTPVLVSRVDPLEFSLKGAPWGSVADGVYIPGYYAVPEGSILEVTFPDGTMRDLTVAGTYETSEQNAFPGVYMGVLVPEEFSRNMVQPTSVQIFLQTPSDLVKQIAGNLGKALPQATVICLPEYLEHFVRQYQNLFVFAAAMSGLAILAGILLVANSVSLAMLERRYEIGVLKAIGYSRWQVQVVLVVEYVLVAAIVSISGLVLIWGFLGVLGLLDGMMGSLLTFEPLTAGLIAAFTIGMTCLTVLLVTWRPANISPVMVLNDRE